MTTIDRTKDTSHRDRWLLRLGIAFLVLAVPAAGFGGHPMATDDTGTVDEGAMEVEMSAEAGRPCDPQQDLHAGMGLSLHAGLHERLDLGASLFYETVVDAEDGWGSGMADPVVDLKLRFYDGDGGAAPSLGVRLDYRAPSAGAAENTGHDVGGVLLLSWEWESAAAHLDLGGYGVGLGTEEAGPSVFASLSLLTRVAPELQLGIEGVIESHAIGEVDALSAMTGVFWETGDTMLSLGVGPTWTEDHRVGWLGTAGVTTAFAGS